jgi:hypothetical protein
VGKHSKERKGSRKEEQGKKKALLLRNARDEDDFLK